MSTSPDPRHEQPGTYPVQDRANEDELKRVHIQDQMLNANMGGPLPEQDDPGRFNSVLDVGCGTGDWLIELAKAYPNIPRLIGVDVSGPMLAFAREQAAAEGVGERVKFLLMDALRMLEFPNRYFDLVNQRAGMSWIRTWDWPKLLQEYLRVCRSEGVIRITEADTFPTGNSPALMQLNELMVKAFYQSGRFFHPAGTGITTELIDLLSRHGIRNLQTRVYPLEYPIGTEAGRLFVEDMQRAYRTFKPFFQKWLRLPNDYDEIYQRAVNEMNEPGFVGTSVLLTMWGNKL